jgi:AcrR family transcriptional regulator
MTDSAPSSTPKALAPRRSPRQARSKERLQRILDATAELLEESGVEGISTRLIASRAEVNVATIYQFFPNKYAVLNALAERTAGRLLQGYLQLVGSIPPGLRLRRRRSGFWTGSCARWR